MLSLSKKITHIAIETLETLQADNVTTIKVGHLTSIAEQLIICSARSTPHLQMIAEKLAQVFKQHALPCRLIDKNSSEWILIDANNVIIHIMMPETRRLYALERLWNTPA
jgi:ribosome-associated protein